jgi:hypothetical protein
MDYQVTNLKNNGKYPFVISQACHTGGFTGLLTADCISEKIVSFSANSGYVGCFASYKAQSWIYTTVFPTSIQEFILAAVYQDQSSVLGEAILEARTAVTLTYPRHYTYNLFGDPA